MIRWLLTFWLAFFFILPAALFTLGLVVYLIRRFIIWLFAEPWHE